VDERAARRVDEDRVRLHEAEQPPVDEPLRLRTVREMERDHVRRGEQLFELDERRAELPLALRRTPPRPADDRHPERLAELDRPRPDRARADDAEPPPAQLEPFGLLPRAGP